MKSDPMKNRRNVKIALYEPDSDLRSVIRGAMRDIGFASIRDTERHKVIQDEIKSSNLDMLICDVTRRAEDICTMITSMRSRNLGKNPFPIVIGLTHDPDHVHISRALNSGLDGVLLKPMDLHILKRRITFFTRCRKPFVVTSTYVGPDRRAKPRCEQASAHSLIVPNPVKMICDGMQRELVKTHVREAGYELDEQKVLRDILSIRWLAGEIERGVIGTVASASVTDLILQLVGQIENVNDRIHRTIYAEAADIAASLINATENLRVMSHSPRPEDIKRVSNLTNALVDAVNVNRETRPNAASTTLQPAHPV